MKEVTRVAKILVLVKITKNQHGKIVSYHIDPNIYRTPMNIKNELLLLKSLSSKEFNLTG